MKQIRSALHHLLSLVFLTMVLAGCGGGSDDSKTNEASAGISEILDRPASESENVKELQGIWFNSVDSGDDILEVLIEPNGTAWMLADNFIGIGLLGPDSEAVIGEMHSNSDNPGQLGTFSVDLDSESPDLARLKLWEEGILVRDTELSQYGHSEALLENIVGTWGFTDDLNGDRKFDYAFSMSIDATGSINGSDSEGCIFAGEVFPKYNRGPFFNTRIEVSNCAEFEKEGIIEATSFIYTNEKGRRFINLRGDHSALGIYVDFYPEL